MQHCLEGCELNVRQGRGCYGACDVTLPETLCKTKSLPLYWDPCLHRPSRDRVNGYSKQNKTKFVSFGATVALRRDSMYLLVGFWNSRRALRRSRVVLHNGCRNPGDDKGKTKEN